MNLGRFSRTCASAVSVFLLIFSIACGGGNKTQARVMNASPGESSVNVTLNGTSIATGLGYGAATNYMSVTAGSPSLIIVPDGGTTDLINETVNINSGSTYTILADNFPSDVGLTILTDDNSAPASGNLNMRIVNAAPGLGTVDVYVVAPGTNLDTVTPSVTGLAFQAASSYLSLAAGNYEIFFTLTGQKFAYIDSGAQSFSAGQVRTVVGLNGESTGYTATVLADLN